VATPYDAIGRGYAQVRRPDPRVEARIHAALGDARIVVNVGAGAGCYEPATTIAVVEPSEVMIAQRPPGSARVIKASAESIPLADGCVDAADYFPEAFDRDDGRAVPIPRLVELLGGRAPVEPVLVPHDCTDGFGIAYWRRPQRYLDPIVRAGISLFSQVDEVTLRPGLDRLAADLRFGAWQERYAHLLTLDEYDGGYRLVITEVP